jgi:nicotinate-nucleotide adenylyltransferase
MMQRAIVFGGTFDPVHVGHLAVAAQVLARTGAAAVWFVPAGVAPLRPPALATLPARLALLHAAVRDRPGLEVLDIETHRGGVSHTVDTVAQLHQLRPDVELDILLGADAARSIGQWPGHVRLLECEHFVIVNRSGVLPFDDEAAAAAGYDRARTAVLEIESPPISASEVRRRVAAGESLDGLVPDAVATLIGDLGLYRSEAGRA